MAKPSTRLATRLAAFAVDVLLPCRCLGCGTIEPGSMRCGLCRACRDRLAPVPRPGGSACRRCGALLAGAVFGTKADACCIPCLASRSALDRLYCLWTYRPPLDAVVQGLKFQNLPYLGRHLGLELAERLPENLDVDAVVPVPLHWTRRWVRGYDQALEIAASVAAEANWPLERYLIRRRPTRPQSQLARSKRRSNLRRAFHCRKRVRGAFRRLLLVDDVYTTGATLEAAAAALKTQGAAWVGAAVVGRTPDPKH